MSNIFSSLVSISLLYLGVASASSISYGTGFLGGGAETVETRLEGEFSINNKLSILGSISPTVASFPNATPLGAGITYFLNGPTQSAIYYSTLRIHGIDPLSNWLKPIFRTPTTSGYAVTLTGGRRFPLNNSPFFINAEVGLSLPVLHGRAAETGIVFRLSTGYRF